MPLRITGYTIMQAALGDSVVIAGADAENDEIGTVVGFDVLQDSDLLVAVVYSTNTGVIHFLREPYAYTYPDLPFVKVWRRETTVAGIMDALRSNAAHYRDHRTGPEWRFFPVVIG